MKKELFLPLIIFALTLVFAVICLMVYLSKGNAYWIKRKLKIGALLLTFSWFANSCEKNPFGNTCYDPMPAENSIWIDKGGDSLIYAISDSMFIQITNPSYPFFSFDIYDFEANLLESGLLTKRDSLPYDTYYFIIFDKDYKAGDYKINFYGESENSITKKIKINTFEFKIK
jgi:hypothetical protein